MSSRPTAEVVRIGDPHAGRSPMQRRVLGAAAALLDESARPDVSMAELAARARVARSALCAQFGSVDAVFAELYLLYVSALPLIVDEAATAQSRVSSQLRAVALILAERPGLAHACTTALLSTGDAAVAEVRTRIAAEVHRRLAAALGTGAWPEVVATLQTLFWGALLQVQSGDVGYRAMADRLDTMVALILPGDAG